MRNYLVRIVICLLACGLVNPVAGARTIEFETTEVTAADVALSPDGQWLIFTMLGHLFRLPVEGGTAEQLTFGLYYDSDPVFSPDGARVAFVSDRDGSSGNVFVLELATGQITQVTHEPWAGRPTWTPDGQAIVYLGRQEPRARTALLRRSKLGGGEPETVSADPRRYRSIFYLPDGRLAWTVIERKRESPPWSTRIEVMDPEGTVSTLRTFAGRARHVAASPTGDGFYCHLERDARALREELVFLPPADGVERLVVPLSPRQRSQFAVAADNKHLYLGHAGRLWRIALPSGTREPIPFRAQVTLEIHEPVWPPKWSPAAVGTSVAPHSVTSPRLSPDGHSLVFVAAGHLWRQPLEGSESAQRLFQGSAFEEAPAFSPNGRQLAFLCSQYGNTELRVFDFESQQMRTLLASGFSWWSGQPSWSPDGKRLLFVEREGFASQTVAVNLSDGKKQTIAAASPARPWSLRSHFSPDGASLYFSANTTGTGTLYRLRLQENAEPEPVTQLERHLSDGLVSPDGKWLAFRRNKEIWVAPLGTEPIQEKDVRQLSPEGGDTFAFTPDGAALIYAAGNRVWRHPLAGGEREEIPIRLELQRPTPPPLLLRQVRVLDFAAGGFGPEISLFIEQGRIAWIGSEGRRSLPPQTVIVDAGGRFAIPGLFDFHVHAGRANQEAFLAYGVTSVRDTGGWLAGLKALADRSETTSDPVPRYFFSGDVFEGAQPAWGDAYLLIVSEDDARGYVRRWKQRGAHFIKVYPSLSWPLQRVVAEEARRLGLPVVGHGMYVEQVLKSVLLGYATLEHVTPNRLYEDVLQMLALAGTRWNPTLTVMGGASLLLRDQPERLSEAKFRTFTTEWFIRFLQMFDLFRAVDDKTLRGIWAEKLADVRAAYHRGIRLQAGPEGLFGSSLHWELEFFVQAGIPPLEVLRIATQEAAAAVGAEDDLGTLEPGKLADLVLLDANPLEDIRNTESIWRVIKGGWLFDPEKLRPPVSVAAQK